MRGASVRKIAGPVALVLVSMGILACPELLLRLFGVGSDAYSALDFGYELEEPLWAPDPAHPDMMVPAPWIRAIGRHAGLHMLLQEFPRRRGEQEIRIIAVGDSTVYGYPQVKWDSFPFVLARLVNERHPDVEVRAINAGVPGHDARSTLNVLREVLRYEPSLVIWYGAHNEFLKRFALEQLRRLGPVMRARLLLLELRTYQLLRWMLSPVLSRIAPPDVSPLVRELERQESFATPRSLFETQAIVERFRINLELTIDAARQARVPIVLCTMAGNVKIYPKRSVHDPGTPAELEQRAQTLRRKAEGAWECEDYTAMECLMREALQLTPGHAKLRWLLGQALEGKGDLPAALEQYILSRDLESRASRATSEMNRLIRDIGRTRGAIVVDMERVFLGQEGHGHWGEKLFSDHCHPTHEGHRLMAETLYQAMDWQRYAGGQAKSPRRRRRPPRAMATKSAA